MNIVSSRRLMCREPSIFAKPLFAYCPLVVSYDHDEKKRIPVKNFLYCLYNYEGILLKCLQRDLIFSLLASGVTPVDSLRTIT